MKSSKAVRRFKKFHGREPDKITSVNIPLPKKLVYIGKAKSIEYVSDKKFGRIKKMRKYIHKIGPGVHIYTEPSGKCLFVTGGKFRVTDWLRG